ncbi:hypothetical protein [Rhizobium sp. BE258]|uniref:phage tail assembly chaperone n=1 Tax=Rhizobium sp. BE258 TaxID=2817722 RepID=UPI002866C2C3|nr:hypothetical protein [Rhizobium sp. BE258]MDR7147047.1 hypothetical protein [Rhizobium sp. BE258]
MTRDRLKKLLVEELKRNMVQGGRPRLPEGGKLLWGIFLDLDRGRSLHASGANPIAATDIEAYARLHRWPLQPHHVDILVAMDRAFLEVSYEQMRQARDGKTSDGTKVLPRRSSHAVTPQVFDAMFG